MNLKFLKLITLNLTVFFLSNKLLFKDEIYYNDFLTEENILNLINFQKKWEWVSYAIVPLLLLLKTTIVASVLYIGTFFFSKIKVTFKQLWEVAIKAEFIFLGVWFLKIIWFCFFQTNYTLEDLQYFFPLSALNIIGYQDLEAWFVYPLQTLNLFELTYWLLLSYFVGTLAFTEKDNGKPMDLGLKIVVSSYGSALLLWVIAVMFFTLNYS